MTLRAFSLALFAGILGLSAFAPRPADDPLSSWHDGPTKKALLDFVAKVTKEGGPDFVPVADRLLEDRRQHNRAKPCRLQRTKRIDARGER